MPKVNYVGPRERSFKARNNATGETFQVYPGKALTLSEENAAALVKQHPALFEIVSGKAKKQVAPPLPDHDILEDAFDGASNDANAS